MAHEINSMAYVGERPWHGLGTKLQRGAPIEQWIKDSGMQWRIEAAPVEYGIPGAGGTAYATYGGTNVLYRSDNQLPLSIVSKDYKVVQPSELLEFYRDLAETDGSQLETAGCLRGGRRFWALARMQETIELPGNDTIGGYLLLASSCDSTLATSVIPTSIRVVCNNTLHASIHGAEGGIRVPHSRKFDAEAVKAKLETARKQWQDYAGLTQLMARKKVSAQEAIRFFEVALGSFAANDEEKKGMNRHRIALTSVKALYSGQGRGSNLPSSHETVWGLVNAVTEYTDHYRKTRTEDGRLSSAWFGGGARMKQRALEQAVFML